MPKVVVSLRSVIYINQRCLAHKNQKSENLGMVLSSAILLGFADSTKKADTSVGPPEAEKPNKDIGMFNPTYE